VGARACYIEGGALGGEYNKMCLPERHVLSEEAGGGGVPSMMRARARSSRFRKRACGIDGRALQRVGFAFARMDPWGCRR
jgi:hypothetical protein